MRSGFIKRRKGDGKRSFVTLVLGLAILLCSSAARAVVSLEFVPVSQQVLLGTPVTVAIKNILEEKY